MNINWSRIILVVILVTGISGLVPATGNEKPSSVINLSGKKMLDQFRWLLGTWQNLSPDGSFYENWIQLNDSSFAGNSCFVKDSDTLSYEKISLEQQGDDLYYIPIVPGQNAGLPVKFRLTSANGNFFKFENPAHDFPQQITYQQINDDSLLAEIAGIVQGKLRSQQFPMSRKK